MSAIVLSGGRILNIGGGIFSTGGAAPPPPASTTVTKFTPGPILMTVAQNGAVTAEINTLAASYKQGGTGACIGYSPWFEWSSIEPTLGNYVWTNIDNGFLSLQSAAPGALYFPQFLWMFNGTVLVSAMPTYNPQGSGIPAYIVNNPGTYGAGPSGTSTSYGGWMVQGYNGSNAYGYTVAAFYRSVIYERILALYQAYANHIIPDGLGFTVDQHPLIGGVGTSVPTDLSVQEAPNIPGDYTYQAVNDAWEVLVGAGGIKQYFPHTPTFIMPGFGPNSFTGANDPTQQNVIVKAMNTNGLALSCTDVAYPQSLTYAQNYFVGNNYNGSTGFQTPLYWDMHSIPSVQGDDYTSSTQAQVSGILGVCYNTLKAQNVMLCVTSPNYPPGTGYGIPSFWNNFVLPVINAYSVPTQNQELPVGYMAAPPNFTAVASGSSVIMSWSPQTTYTGLNLVYKIYRNGTLIETTANTSVSTYTDPGPLSAGSYTYAINLSNDNGAGPQSSANANVVANPVGLNLYNVQAGNDQAFLNIVKTASGSDASGLNYVSAWATYNGSTPTKEEPFVALDSNGYPTSLTWTGSGSQQFTSLKTFMYGGLANYSVPGASTLYPAGNYRFQFTGNGSLTVGGDASAVSQSASSGSTISGTTLTITDGGTHSMLFNVVTPSQNGLSLTLNSVGGGSGTQVYPVNESIVLQSQAASYDAGAVFNPIFLSAWANVSCFRFMDWMFTNNRYDVIYTSAGQTAGQTSLTVNGWQQGAGANGQAPAPGTYNLYFQGGEVRSVTVTASTQSPYVGSTTLSWSGGLTVTNASFVNPVLVWVDNSFSGRALPSNCTWASFKGVPFEIMGLLCNTIGAHAWTTSPLERPVSEVVQFSQLMLNGTGSTLASFTGLNAGLNHYDESSNEVWNSQFAQYNLAVSLGAAQWYPAVDTNTYGLNRSFYGQRCALVAAALQSGLGTSFARCYPLLAGQQADGNFNSYALLAPDWTSGSGRTGAPYTYPIKGQPIGGYFSFPPAQSDFTYMQGLADGGYTDWFSIYTSQTGTSGHNYSATFNQYGISGAGWFSQIESQWSGYKSYMTSIGAAIPLMIYEGGYYFSDNSNYPTNWQSFAFTALRDSRMGAIVTQYFNLWKSNVGGTATNINNWFDSTNPYEGATWSLLESMMQTLSPLANAPALYQGYLGYIG